MRVVLQRVSGASVSVGGRVVGEIGFGLLALVGFRAGDEAGVAGRMAGKILRLRIFPDAEGKANLSVGDLGGGILAVSQFTLYADCGKGNRPSFFEAAGSDEAKALYGSFVGALRGLSAESAGVRAGRAAQSAASPLGGGAPDTAGRGLFGKVAQGEFGAMMEVALVNDGPFTVVLDM
ncbi:MAG: D-aminoacyl-tRNA deacylase [Oscillospiraceae bacterium]|nr:D-aminoacyl-tRNA deacylase [Oscillospiraceae bacterium]